MGEQRPTLRVEAVASDKSRDPTYRETSVSALSIPSFRLLFLSRMVSSAGFWMDQVATGWLALEVGGDPRAVGTVMALRLLPFLLFGIVAGTVADRFPRRSILLAVGVLAALLAAAMSAIASSSSVRLWEIALIGFVSGSVMVFDFPTRTAFAVDLVGRERLAQGVALTAVGFYLFAALGAFAGGQAIPRLGVGGAYQVVAACHLVGLGLVALIRGAPPRVGQREAPARFASAVGGAARLIWQNPAVRMVIISSLVVELFGYSYQTAVPPLARDVLHVGPTGLGTLSAGASVGATIAVALLALMPATVRRQPVLTGVIVAWGVGQLALGAAPSFLPALLAMMLCGGCASAVDTLQQTLVQLAVPEEQRGRAMGVWVFSIGTNAFGYYQVGLVATALTPALALGLNGGLAALFALLIFALAPTYRWRPGAVAPAAAPAESQPELSPTRSLPP
jgi:MFS family permease